MGIYLVSVSIVGYMLRPIRPALRLAFAVSGILMMIPANGFLGAIWTNIVGFVVGTGLLLAEIGARNPYRGKRSERSDTSGASP